MLNQILKVSLLLLLGSVAIAAESKVHGGARIYLYPPTPTLVTVKLHPTEPIRFSKPPHGAAWKVDALPSGQIRPQGSRRTYSYLYWESSGAAPALPSEGYVVEQFRVQSFLETTLTSLGLSNDEIADLLKNWLPQLKHAPYYFFAFQDEATISHRSPLQIDPLPSSVIRVLMSYRPLQFPTTAEPPRLPTRPTRTGFTVVEWDVEPLP